MAAEDERDERAELALLPTAVPGLDTVLGGGFVAGGAYLIAGTPGTGKTTLGNHLAFAHAARGETAVFATILAESHDRMLAHMRQYAFVDPAAVGKRVHYVNLQRTVDEEGLPALLAEARRVVREQRATLLIVDGTTAAEERAASRLAFQRFTQQLQVQSTLLGCTTVILSHRDPGEVDEIATHVDGVVMLARERIGGRTVRWLEVTKLRGAAHLTGRHDLAFTPAGIAVYPRLEAAARPESAAPPNINDRCAFGVPGLDAMLAGGLPGGSSTLLLGAGGTGKTISALHFAAEGARRGEPVLIASFRESAAGLAATAAGLGHDIGQYLASGLIRVVWRPPLDLSPDEWAWQILSIAAEHRPRRAIVDPFSDVARSIEPVGRSFAFALTLAAALQAHGATSLFTVELDALRADDQPLPATLTAADNAILLRAVEVEARRRRLVSVLKIRQSGFDLDIRELTIGDGGLHVGDPFAPPPRPANPDWRDR